MQAIKHFRVDIKATSDQKGIWIKCKVRNTLMQEEWMGSFGIWTTNRRTRIISADN